MANKVANANIEIDPQYAPAVTIETAINELLEHVYETYGLTDIAIRQLMSNPLVHEYIRSLAVFVGFPVQIGRRDV